MWLWGGNTLFEHVSLKTKFAKGFPAFKEALEHGSRCKMEIEVSLPGHRTRIKQARSILSAH